jgi:hypothetical protein
MAWAEQATQSTEPRLKKGGTSAEKSSSENRYVIDIDIVLKIGIETVDIISLSILCAIDTDIVRKNLYGNRRYYFTFNFM